VFLNDHLLPAAALHHYGRILIQLTVALAACRQRARKSIELE
jgi:hypothetical protein